MMMVMIRVLIIMAAIMRTKRQKFSFEGKKRGAKIHTHTKSLQGNNQTKQIHRQATNLPPGVAKEQQKYNQTKQIKKI